MRGVQYVLGGVFLVALGIVFAVLPIRMQGRIVEVVTFGDWPLEWAIRKHFHEMQPELRAISEFVAENPEVERVSVVPSGLRTSPQSKPSHDYDYENPSIPQAIRSLEAYWVSVHDGRTHVFMGTENRSGFAFHAGYTERGPGDLEAPICAEFRKENRERIGVCAIPLDDQWYIRYQWEPEDIEELEEALRQKQQ